MLNSSGENKYPYLLQHLSFELPHCLLLIALVSVNLGGGQDYYIFLLLMLTPEMHLSLFLQELVIL